MSNTEFLFCFVLFIIPLAYVDSAVGATAAAVSWYKPKLFRFRSENDYNNLVCYFRLKPSETRSNKQNQNLLTEPQKPQNAAALLYNTEYV